MGPTLKLKKSWRGVGGEGAAPPPQCTRCKECIAGVDLVVVVVVVAVVVVAVVVVVVVGGCCCCCWCCPGCCPGCCPCCCCRHRCPRLLHARF